MGTIGILVINLRGILIDFAKDRDCLKLDLLTLQGKNINLLDVSEVVYLLSFTYLRYNVIFIFEFLYLFEK
jgi:hypothetical protein